MDEAAERWRRQLEAWAIPEAILKRAPRSPWGFPAWLFDRDPEGGDTPSRRRALEALGQAGTVLDVGAGAGRASLALVPPATLVVAVDPDAELLAAFARRAEEAGVDHAEVEGRWPDVAGRVEPADVVVCHHVFYNVADLTPFAQALDDHARRRVVVELTAVHPMAPLNPLWRRFWGLERPQGPRAEDALEVLREAGIEARIERFERPSVWLDAPEERMVEFARLRLCLPPERDPEVRAALEDLDLRRPRPTATIWWDRRW